MRERYIWAAVAGILIVSVFGWNAAHPVNQEAGTASLPAPQTRPAIAATRRAAPATLGAQGGEAAPLGQQIEQLIAAHDPEDEYKAYWLIRDCEIFNREHDRLIFDMDEVSQKHGLFPYRGMNDSEKQHDAKLCTGMTERTRTSRFEYLADAAKAGVSGAAVEIAEEGPFGDHSALTARPDDPLVQEWKAHVKDQLAKEAENGDLLTLNYLWVRSLMGDEIVGKDPLLAYRYAVAQGLIFKETQGPESEIAALYAPDSPIILSPTNLSAEQRAAQLVAAQHIADNARERRHH